MQLRKDRVNTGNAMTSSPQSRNRLGERRSENNTLPTYIWKKKARSEGEESKKDGKG